MKLFNFLKKEDTNKKLKLQYLANLFLVAKSDGIVSKEEEDKIDEIRKSIPEFKISYTPDYRQEIADSWPKSINDASAKEDCDLCYQLELQRN